MDVQGAIDSLLGRLTAVLVNEAQLLGGVRGDVEFIKDELESMKGLLLHLTEAQHRDHQVRAWMNGLTRDCGNNVELYVHYLGGRPGSNGLLGHARRVLQFLCTVRVRHQIAMRIQELKVRARDVGDGRQRYGVIVPPALLPGQHNTVIIDRPAPPPGGPEEEEDIRRRELLYGEPPDTVEEGTKKVLQWIFNERDTTGIGHRKLFFIEGRVVLSTTRGGNVYCDKRFDVLTGPTTRPFFFRSRALVLANCRFSLVDEVLNECYPDAFALQMLLHLLYVYPNRSERELNRLRNILKGDGNNIAKTMLMFCYNELPVNYKSCLLYLSIFPHDHPIRRTSLLRRWIAEGLMISETSIATSKGGLEDQAEHIFDALVTRGFIRPEDTSTSGKIKSFSVHHTVQEFIATNVSLVETSLPHDVAHRLSINSGIAVQEAYNSNCSLDVTQTLVESMPRNTDVTELPKQIEKLQCLEMLDIRQTAIRAFSTTSVWLPMLRYLLAGHKSTPDNNSDRFHKSFVTVRLPSGIRRMQKLEILSQVEVSDSIDNLVDMALGRVYLASPLRPAVTTEKIGFRINQPLQRQSIPDAEAVPTLVTPPKLLESLSISGITSGLPLWIVELDQLAKVTLKDTSLGDDSINILGKLKMLRCLRLLHKSYSGNNLNFMAEEFQRLRFLIVEGCDITTVSFDAGAGPKLERIIWSFASMEGLSGINHLPNLKKLELDGNCNDLDSIKKALKAHPNHPELKHKPHHQSPEVGTAAAASSSSVS
ncbi:hypothetical protein PR202_gb13636 [Eleusine coracana subsp. coracana]|uniref:Rx N-terminal domain-containing protein n=1 Tax=Eleusine coracana subsp. coracana TaxID=191504 RepID=A0AAV5EU82_ELECO|nr:hypothetical protein PR202_gb13636 [Eleusine coracana subsp. coracana]